MNHGQGQPSHRPRRKYFGLTAEAWTVIGAAATVIGVVIALIPLLTRNGGSTHQSGSGGPTSSNGTRSAPYSPPPSPTFSSPTPVTTPPPSSPTEAGYYLADFNTVQTYGINVDSVPRTVNGVMYGHPVAWYASPGADDPYWAEWDLSRNCAWLTSPGVGISDEAPSGSQYIFYIQTDGSYKWQKTISLGQSDGVRVSIKGALRLRLSVAGLKNGYWGPYATWGDAKVWCYSEPPNRKG